MTGGESPYSWKIRAPTYANILALKPILLGSQIADIPICVASIDPCMSCLNRAIMPEENKSIGMKQLHELSIQKTLEMMGEKK